MTVDTIHLFLVSILVTFTHACESSVRARPRDHMLKPCCLLSSSYSYDNVHFIDCRYSPTTGALDYGTTPSESRDFCYSYVSDQNEREKKCLSPLLRQDCGARPKCWAGSRLGSAVIDDPLRCLWPPYTFSFRPRLPSAV